MTRGDARHGSGRGIGIGRRLRAGAASLVFIGGAIVVGGAATAVTAFAHSGDVLTAQSCTTWSAQVVLANNVTADRWVEVVSTIPGHPGFAPKQGFDTSFGSIWKETGPALATGQVTLNIYLNNNGAPGSVEFTKSASLPTPSGCTADITTKQSADGVVGTALSDTATVTGTVGSPAGTVVFALFPPTNTTCSTAAGADQPVYTSPAIALTSTTPGVSTAASGSYTSAAPGTYHWVAAYTPAANSLYKPAISGCTAEPVTVSQAAPTIVTAAGAGGLVPVDVHDTATVSGGLNPTGTVTFTLYRSVADCNAATNAVASPSTVALASGKATSAAVHLTTAGTYQWVAKYSGDANNASVSSACGDEPVTATTGGAGGVQGITTPSTGGTDSLLGITVGGFLLLGGLGVALMGSIVPRRRRLQ